MIIFDPFYQFNKIISEKTLHLIIKSVMVIISITFLIIRILSYNSFLLKPLWFVETLIYFVLITAFLFRVNPINRSKGLKEIIIPMIGAILPFTLLFSPPNKNIYQNYLLLLIIFWWMTLATTLTIWGIWTLRSSFSITVEARKLITHGPYRWMRHPIYIGEIFTAAAVTCWRFSFTNVLVLFAFVIIQMLRIKWEEEKLERVFPEYKDYRNKTSKT